MEKPIIVRFRGSMQKSRHTVNLRNGMSPLAGAQPHDPEPELKIVIDDGINRRAEEKRALRVHAPRLKARRIFAFVTNFINKIKRATYIPTLGNARAALGFILAALILTSPIPAMSIYENAKEKKLRIETAQRDIISSIGKAAGALKFAELNSAGRSLGKTLEAVAALEKELKLIPAPKIKQLTRVTRDVSISLMEFLKGIENIPELKTSKNTITSIASVVSAITPRLVEANATLAEVDEKDLPQTTKDKIEFAKIGLNGIIADLNRINLLTSMVGEVLNPKKFRRYLIVFQNNAEIRPTGGFMGAIAILDIARGKISKIDIPPGGPYDYGGQLGAYLEPPAPLLLVNDRFELQDSNWHPDFPTSAKNIIWFFEHSGGPTVDGVIAVNFSALEDVLNLVGDVEVDATNPASGEKEKIILTNENIYAVTQGRVESPEARVQNKPKQFIADAAPHVLKKIFDTKDPQKILELIIAAADAAQKKNIQAYFKDKTFQRAVMEFGIDGSIKKVKGGTDFLMVVNANLGGGKTDRLITQDTEHVARVLNDGSVIDTAIIKRTYEHNPKNPWSGPENINYMRVYVPEGSELIEARGFRLPPEENFNASEPWYAQDPGIEKFEETSERDKETGTLIGNEFGKTVFGHWTRTKPGETTLVRFTYRIPFKVFAQEPEGGLKNAVTAALLGAEKETLGYSILLQEQSGVKTGKIKTSAVLPEGFALKWRRESKTGGDVYNAFVGQR